MCELTSPTRDQTHILESEMLATGPPRKSQPILSFIVLLPINLTKYLIIKLAHLTFFFEIFFFFKMNFHPESF